MAKKKDAPHRRRQGPQDNWVEPVGYDKYNEPIYDISSCTVLDEIEADYDPPPETDVLHIQHPNLLQVLPDQSASRIILDWKLDKTLRGEVERVLKPGGTYQEGTGKAPDYQFPVLTSSGKRRRTKRPRLAVKEGTRLMEEAEARLGTVTAHPKERDTANPATSQP